MPLAMACCPVYPIFDAVDVDKLFAKELAVAGSKNTIYFPLTVSNVGVVFAFTVKVAPFWLTFVITN